MDDMLYEIIGLKKMDPCFLNLHIVLNSLVQIKFLGLSTSISSITFIT
jgi:hypothetical protein